MQSGIMKMCQSRVQELQVPADRFEVLVSGSVYIDPCHCSGLVFHLCQQDHTDWEIEAFDVTSDFNAHAAYSGGFVL